MAYNAIFLNPQHLLSFDSTLTNVNVINVANLEFAVKHTDVIDGVDEIKLQGINIPEIAVVDIDKDTSIGSFCWGSDGVLKFIVSKTVVENITDAMNYIWGIFVKYKLNNIRYTDNADIYTMETLTSSGMKVTDTFGTTLDEIKNKMIALDRGLDITQHGFHIHIVRRNLMTPLV